MFFGSKSPGFECSFKTKKCHPLRTAQDRLAVCDTSVSQLPSTARRGWPRILPTSTALPSSWNSWNGSWQHVETIGNLCIHILQHDVHDVTCSRYLNHSGKKTNLCACQSKPVWNWNRAWRSSNFLFQVRGWPISSSRKRAMGFTRHRQKSSSDHRISPDGWISNGCNQPQTLHIIDDLTEHQQWGFNMI